MARYVANGYKLPLLPEVARQVLAERELSMETLRSDLDVVDSFQKEIFYRQVDAEKRIKEFVSDRSFDNLAYAGSHSRVLREILIDKVLTNYIERLRKSDVILFYVRPVKATLRNDGVREQIDWDELMKIDGAIKFMLEMWGLEYFTINSPSMQERVRLVDSVLSKCFLNERGIS